MQPDDLVGTWKREWIDDSTEDALGRAVVCTRAEHRLELGDDGSYALTERLTPTLEDDCLIDTTTVSDIVGEWAVVQGDATDLRYLQLVQLGRVVHVSAPDEVSEPLEDLDVIELLYRFDLARGDRGRELYLSPLGRYREVVR